MSMNRQITTKPHAHDSAVQRDLNPLSSELFKTIARLTSMPNLGQEELVEVQKSLDHAYETNRALLAKYTVTALGPTSVSLVAPVGIPIQDTWRSFQHDLHLGGGSEQLGFSEDQRPEWFPKQPGEKATLGEDVVFVQGAERLSLSEQDRAARNLGLSLAEPHQVVEGLIAGRIAALAQDVAAYEVLQSVAAHLQQPMISAEVVRAVLAQASMAEDAGPIRDRGVSVGAWSGAGLSLPEPDLSDIAVASRKAP
jgi:hypothetical protein